MDLSYGQFVTEFVKLSPQEQKLKEYYLKFGNYMEPEDASDQIGKNHFVTTDNLDFAGIDMQKGYLVLDESIFLSDTSDIVLSKHQRYSKPTLHTHTFFEVIFILKGKCENKIDGQALEMNSGDVCIIPPGVIHSVGVNSDCSVLNILIRQSTFANTFMAFLGESNLLSDFFNKILYSQTYKKYLLFRLRDEKELAQIILQMFWEQRCSHKFCDQILNGMLQVFFCKLLQYGEDKVEYPDSYFYNSDFIAQVQRFIEYHYKQGTLSECAEHFSFNARYLGTLLKKHTGKTFSQLMTDEKMKQAKKLLIETDVPVQKISELVGYQTPSYFMKVFKEQTDCTPSQYRFQHQE